MGRGKAGGAWR